MKRFQLKLKKKITAQPRYYEIGELASEIASVLVIVDTLAATVSELNLVVQTQDYNKTLFAPDWIAVKQPTKFIRNINRKIYTVSMP